MECAANPNSTIYNIPYLFKLSDKIDAHRLKAAVESAIDAHPYVKTRLFLNDDGDIRAARHDDEPPRIETITGKLPELAALTRPYEILNGSLYRAEIYKTPGANYLFLDFHHIICDGTSEMIIVEDINRAYGGKALEKEIYTGFEAALDEEQARQTDSYAGAKAYYDSVFSGCDADCLPVKDRNGAKPAVGRCEFICDTALDEIKAYCDKNKLTLAAFFNGAFGLTLARFIYRDEIVYTTIYNGRSDPRLSRSVTMLVKTLPVYCDTNGDKKVADFLTGMKDGLMQSMSKDIYSFAEISRAYDIKADIIFAYQGADFAFDAIGGEKADVKALSLDAAKAPLHRRGYSRR